MIEDINIQNEVRFSLEKIERKRLEIMAQVKAYCARYIGIPITLLLAVAYYHKIEVSQFLKDYDYFPLFVAIFVAIIYTVLLASHFYKKGRNAYRKVYKDILVSPLMKKIYPDLEYSPESYIDEKAFNDSGLFKQNYNIYTGDDYFSGVINSTPVEFSEITVKSTQKNSSSNSNSTSTMFSGLFMQAGIDKTIKSRIVIDPILIKENMPIPGFLSSILEKFLPDYGKQIKTGNAKFDEDFKLFCNDKQEADSIITPQLIDEIVAVKEQFWKMNADKYNSNFSQFIPKGAMLKLSIHNNLLYFALNGLELFKIQFNKSTLNNDTELIKSLDYINMAIGIAKTISGESK